MTMLFTHKILFLALLMAAACGIPFAANAEAPRYLQVMPGVIDLKVKQRDIVRQTLTLQNTGARPLRLFPSVEDVNPENGDQNFSYAGNADSRSNSLANWIELSRGIIELQPGESKTVPFVIHVNMNAQTGLYHAQLNFTDGGTRDETESKDPDGYVSVNVEVLSDAKEDLQLLKFATDRLAFSGDDVLFNYQLQNIGNQDLLPSGEIRIYDRRGQEVAAVDVNKDGKSITPEQTTQLASAWSAVSGFGQYKALITVRYGKSQTASVQDTIFFWIVPWKQILGLLVATMFVIALLALYFYQWFEERHLQKLAFAGLLKTSPAEAAAVYIPPFPVAPVRPKPLPKNHHEIKPEPKEHIILRVVENVVIGWRLFTTFKQRGRLTPHDIAAERAMAQPRKLEHESLTKHVTEPATTGEGHAQYVAENALRGHEYAMHTEHSIVETNGLPITEDFSGIESGQSSSQHSHGKTVDLKKIRPQNVEVIHEGHTVNLKKRI